MLFYDRNDTDWYQEQFEEQSEGEKCQIRSGDLFVGKDGVVAEVELTEDK